MTATPVLVIADEEGELLETYIEVYQLHKTFVNYGLNMIFEKITPETYENE